MDVLFYTRPASVDRRRGESLGCQKCLGHGSLQKRTLFPILVGPFNTHCLVVSLVTGDVDHWCKPPGDLNVSADDWKNIAIPKKADGCFGRFRAYEVFRAVVEHDTVVDHQDGSAVAPAFGLW
ncbi:hypothetical protein MRX96_024211 [Rhipicephalus microplus]